MAKSFKFTNLVRLDFNFVGVDENERRKIWEAIYDAAIKTYSGGGGDANYGTLYIDADQVELVRELFNKLGFKENIKQ